MRTVHRSTRAIVATVLLPGAAAACRDRNPSPTEAAVPSRSTNPFPEGWAETGELRTGYIVGRDGHPLQITYAVHGTHGFRDGDIDVGPVATIPATESQLQGNPHLRASVNLADPARQWPFGIVPYEIAPGVDASRVRSAIDMVESAVTGVDFVARDPRVHPDYVRFIPADECSSSVGKVGGQQVIRLSDACLAGNIAHEMLHTLGLEHEQNRCDRDAFMDLLVNNMPAGMSSQFIKACSGHRDVGNYNPGSIMHYPAYYQRSATESVQIIRSKYGWEQFMGQRTFVAYTDRAGIDALYPARTPVHRLYNGAIPDHLYTRTAGEGTNAGWRTEANSYFYLGSASASGYRPLFRCWVSGRHYISQDVNCEAGVRAEDQLGFALNWQAIGTRPLYRLVNLRTRDRVETWSDAERDQAIRGGYRNDGILGYVWVRTP